MLKRILPILLASAVLLTACGGTPAAPTVSSVDIQNTAVSAAQTIVALTALAQPTATPLPPTDVPSPTPLPTFTLDPLTMPTLGFPTLMPTVATSSGDPCAHILNVAEAGKIKKNIRVENVSKGTAKFWMTMTSVNSFGQCGYLTGFNNVLKPGGRVKIEIPPGCWLVGAWITGKNGVNTTADGAIHCIGDSKSTDLLRVVIKDSTVSWVGP